MAIPMDYIRKRLGWCLNECPVMERAGMKPERYMDAVPSGRGGLRSSDFSWWNRYRNQLLVIALLASVVSLAFLSLVGGPSAFVWVSIAIGVAIAMIAFAASFSKWYAEIAAGKWRREAVSKIKRLFRWFQDRFSP